MPPAGSKCSVSCSTAVAALDEIALAGDLGLDAPFEVAEAVHVLELGLGPEGVGAGRPDRHVRVAAKAALLHVHVGDAELAQRRAQQRQPLTGLRGIVDVRLGDDLDQRGSAAVEVDQGCARSVDPTGVADMAQLRGVLLHVHPVDADVAEPPAGRKRHVVLADLVALGEVGIEVVLAVEGRPGSNLAAERQGDPDRVGDRLLVDHRQRPRVPEADRAGVGVRLRPELELAAAEHLRARSGAGRGSPGRSSGSGSTRSSAGSGQLRLVIEPDRALDRMGGIEDQRLAEGRAGDLQSDRELWSSDSPSPGAASPAGMEIAGIPASDIGTVQ